MIKKVTEGVVVGAGVFQARSHLYPWYPGLSVQENLAQAKTQKVKWDCLVEGVGLSQNANPYML
jgi:hypothetical protein